MKLYIDNATNSLVTSATITTTPTITLFKEDISSVEIRFVENGLGVDIGTPTIRLALGKDGSLIALTEIWTKNGTGATAYWTGNFNLNTQQAEMVLAGLSSTEAILEVEVRVGTLVATKAQLSVTLKTDLINETDLATDIGNIFSVGGDHIASTTNVHGIANTTDLATKAYADGAGLKAGVQWTDRHTASTGNPYLIGSIVYNNGRVYRCIAENDSMPPQQGGNPYWADLGVGYLLPNENPRIVGGSIDTSTFIQPDETAGVVYNNIPLALSGSFNLKPTYSYNEDEFLLRYAGGSWFVELEGQIIATADTGDEPYPWLATWPSGTSITKEPNRAGGTINTSGGGGSIDTQGVYIGGGAFGLSNGAKLRKGTTDAQSGGYKGIALECSAQYELKWEAGRLFTLQQDGFTIRSVEHCMSAPSSVDDETKGYAVGTRWVMDSGKTYVCTHTGEGNADWEIKFSQENGQEGDGGSINTSNGGGSIDTRGAGWIQLGETGTRTTLNGSASGSDKTITLPNASGTIALTSDLDAKQPLAGVEWTANHTATNPYLVGSIVFYNNNESGVTISGLTGSQSGYNGHYLFISRISGLALYRTSTGQTITQTGIYNGAGYLAGQFIWRLDGLGFQKWGPTPWGQGWGSIPAQNAVETPSQGRVYKCIAQDSSQQAPAVGGNTFWQELGFGFLLPSENPKIVAGTINTQTVGNNVGGTIDTSNAGGSISTSGGGGSINTAGSGSIQFGVSGQRTTLVGSAVVDMTPHNHTITLPRATGTIALTSDVRFGAKTVFTLGGEEKITYALGTSYVYGAHITRPSKVSGGFDQTGLYIQGNWTITGLIIMAIYSSTGTAGVTYGLVKINNASSVTNLWTAPSTSGLNNGLNIVNNTLNVSLSDGDKIGFQLTIGNAGTVPTNLNSISILANVYCVPR